MNNRIIVKAMSAIADTYRLSILIELSRKACLTPSDIHQLTGLSQSTVSYHIKRLIDGELINEKKEGRNLYLTLNREALQQLSTFLDQLTTKGIVEDKHLLA